MNTQHEVERLLKQYWREDGNPRLKGLFLAGMSNSEATSQQVAEAWPTAPDERDRLLSARDDGGMGVPRSQQYRPGSHHTDFESRPESGVARTLARDEFGDKEGMKRFLAGDASMDKDTYIKRALLQNAPTELDTLFREELETTFIMGAQPRKIFRDAANVRTVSRQKGDLPRESDEPYANVGGYQDEIGTGEQGFDTVPYDLKKISLGFEIPDELQAQSEPDAYESLARGVGAAVENTLNRICLVELVDNAGETVDADVGGTEDLSAVQALNAGSTAVDLNDYGEADTAVVHPEFEQAIFDDTNVVYANRSGETQPVQDRQMGSIMGMDRYKSSSGSYNNAGETKTLDPDGTWGYDGADEIGAVTYVQEHFNLILWNQFDMEMRTYEDPIRDLEGANIRTWCDAEFGQSGAASTITHSTS